MSVNKHRIRFYDTISGEICYLDGITAINQELDGYSNQIILEVVLDEQTFLAIKNISLAQKL